MSTYDDASLVFYPSGYKTSVLYSEKPMDANGQLTFTRASNATRVVPNGLIEEVRTNLLTYSQDFSNAAWVKAAAGSGTAPVVTANDGTAPDGTTTADKVVFVATDSTGISELAQSSVKNGTYAGSVYIKAFAAGDVGKIIGFRFASGTYALITLTADWQRYSVSQTGTLSTFDVTLRPSQGTSTGTVSVYLWGAQLETVDIATQYIVTTTSARSTFAGITVDGTSVPNVPRIDYTGGGCGKLLLEPQRTNICLWSENFNNAAWGKTNAIVTANSVTSPDGYLNADLLQSLSSTEPRIRQTTTQTGIAAFTFSCFAKKGNVDFLILRNIAVNSAGGSRAWFNLNTGVVGTVNAGLTASMVSYGNGWYRCVISGTTEALPTNLVDISLSATDNSISGSAIGSNIYIYGAQLEAGAYATSYINTLSTSVTRVADAASKTGISSLIGQTEGTLFVEFQNDANSNSAIDRIISISDGTTNNRLYLAKTSAGASSFVAVSGGTQTGSITGSAIPTGNVKIAVAYKTDDCIIYINGVAAGTDTSVTIPACSQLFLGRENGVTTDGLFKPYKQALVFKTRLSNSTLARLTQL